MKNILITGASSGIGEALAYCYAKDKTNILFLCGRNIERLNLVAQKCMAYGATVYVDIVDVTSRTQTENWINNCHNIAPLNLVIANAGVATGDDENIEAIYNTFNVNVNGVLNTVLISLELFKTSKHIGKQIAIISSMAGYHGMPSCPAYSASKACVKALGEALRGRYGKKKIKVNVICPGFVRSRITDVNKFPMPFFMEAEKAALIIEKGLKKNIGLISFPWQIRFVTWLLSTLPNKISDFIYARLPHKV